MSKSAILVLLFAILLAGCKKHPEIPCSEFYSVEYYSENEVPPHDDPAVGMGWLIIDFNDSTAVFSVIISPIDSVTGFHFHAGASGVNGPVIVTLLEIMPPYNIISRKLLAARIEFSAADFQGPAAGEPFLYFVNLVRAGEVYSNVHTINHPPGASRGQILPFQL